MKRGGRIDEAVYILPAIRVQLIPYASIGGLTRFAQRVIIFLP